LITACTDEQDTYLFPLYADSGIRLFVIDRLGRSLRTSGTLSDIEKALPSYFIRINKSTLANERKISCFKTTFSGGVDAILKCGYKDYVSRRCFAEIKRRYKV
jgi:DNA-binding LytR/AlgR family response regulator